MKEFICKYGVQLSVALCLIAIPLSLLWQSSVTILLFCFLLSLNIVFHILGFWKSYREYIAACNLKGGGSQCRKRQ